MRGTVSQHATAPQRWVLPAALVLALATCSALPQGGPDPAGTAALVTLDAPAPTLAAPIPADDRSELAPPPGVRSEPRGADGSESAPTPADLDAAADDAEADGPAATEERAEAEPASGQPLPEATAAVEGAPDEPPVAAPAAPAPPPPPAPAVAPSPAPAEAGQPTRISIERIGVANPLTAVGLHADRTLVVPEDERVGGWYTGAPQPGQRGPAIIAGHNSWNGRTGIFWRLHELQPGDRIDVHNDDGSVVTFTVDRLEQHPKDAFPTQRVYGNTDGPELRIITCGGPFDQRRRSHVDNVIVFASRTG